MTFWQQVKSRRLLAAMLVLTAGLYVQVWQHTLIWDEHTLTAQQIVLHPSLKHYARSTQETYRPLALLSVAIDHLVWRGWPPGYAVDSLLIHLAVVALFFHLIRGWVAPFPAAASTLLVALHPVGAETVHYLLGRPDLLSAACLLAALLFFTRLDQTNRQPVTLVLFLVCGLIAFAAKETAIVLPILVLMLIVTPATSPGERSGWKQGRLAALVLCVALGSLYVSARLWGWIPVGAPRLHLDVDTLTVMVSTASIAGGAVFLPFDLCPWYEGLITVTSSTWLVLGSLGVLLIGLIGVMYLIWQFRQRLPAVSVGLAWMIGILMLIAVRAAADPAPLNPLAVRWLYPAVIGAALIVGGLLHWAEPLWPRSSRAATVCGVLLLMGLTWKAQPIWQNDLALFERAVECNPGSAFITLQYIDLLNDAGKHDQADRLFAHLRAQQPEHPRVLFRLVRQAIDQGDYHNAIDRLHALLLVAPSLVTYRMLGDLLALTDQPKPAIEAYRLALSYQPRDMLALTALGSVYERARQWDEAAALYRDELTQYPDAVNLWFRLGRVNERAGRLREASNAFEQVIKFDRYCSDGYLAEARVRQQLGDRPSAEETLQRYTALAHQPAVPRPTSDPLDAPCGGEPKIIYRKTGAASPVPGPAQQALP
jgi:protein O-mannosyl-transferase